MSGCPLGRLCQSFDQDAAHCHVEEGLAGFGQSFIILGETPIAGEPGEGAFNDPSARQDVEAGRDDRWLLSGSAPEALDAGPPMFGDRQRPSKMFLDPDLETLIAGVGPYERYGGEQEVEEAEQEHAA